MLLKLFVKILWNDQTAISSSRHDFYGTNECLLNVSIYFLIGDSRSIYFVFTGSLYLFSGNRRYARAHGLQLLSVAIGRQFIERPPKAVSLPQRSTRVLIVYFNR